MVSVTGISFVITSSSISFDIYFGKWDECKPKLEAISPIFVFPFEIDSKILK